MTAQLSEPANLVLQPRNVTFDWSQVPLHWIPGEPVATHFINVLHMLLPAGEAWFVEVFQQAMPYIRDERVRSDVVGFIGQEAVHSAAHDSFLDHLATQGIDARPFTRHVEYIFGELLGDRRLTGPRAKAWLFERVALIAAIEHFTHMLGDWILNAEALDRVGADPTMLDLLRWHGAEEVEHRHVAHDLYLHLDGRYSVRMRAMAQTVGALLTLWHRGHRFLLAGDPVVRGRVRGGLQHVRTLGPRGLLPTQRDFLSSLRRYTSHSYSPLHEGSTEQALAYLASSPAAQAGLR